MKIGEVTVKGKTYTIIQVEPCILGREKTLDEYMILRYDTSSEKTHDSRPVRSYTRSGGPKTARALVVENKAKNVFFNDFDPFVATKHPHSFQSRFIPNPRQFGRLYIEKYGFLTFGFYVWCNLGSFLRSWLGVCLHDARATLIRVRFQSRMFWLL